MNKLKEKQVGIVELRKNFKKYLDLVNNKGWTIIIENYRKPIAKLEKFDPSRSEHPYTEGAQLSEEEQNARTPRSPFLETFHDTIHTDVNTEEKSDVARSLRDDDDRLGHDYDDMEGFIPG
jgi:antitoxin (DNA-binding transcriptional repressor) of toxin-antitoxin stability system